MKSKRWDSKPAPPHNNMMEPAKKEGKKKKSAQMYKKKHTGNQKKQFLVISVNTKAPKKKIRARGFNRNKKSHYGNDYTKPSKN